MFIRKIKLRNFKSFKKAEIEFRDNFTVITGPNGSGKSNIIDSILFCFGISSSKTLRADKLTDLIKHGQKEAEVTIELDGYIVRRRVKKTDKGYYSYYYINGKSVSYSDIERLIEKLGLNTEYNIVMQGDVTRVAEMTPIQRRKIIEDIAGISEFEEKKEKALEELEEVKRNIEKVEITIKEVDDRLSQLKVEREEAIKYKNLVEERELLLNYKRIHEYLRLVNTANSLRKRLEELNEERDQILKAITDINSRLVNLNEEVKEIVDRIESFKDSRLKRINEEINVVSNEISGLKKLISLFSSEVEDLNREKEKTLISLQRAEEEIKRINEELRDIDVKMESLENILNEKISYLNALKIKYDEITSRFRAQREELESKLNLLNELKEKRTSLLKEREKILEGLRRIGMEIDDMELSREKIDLSRIFDEIAEDERNLAILKNEMDKLKLKLFEIDGEIFKLRDEIAKIDKEIREKEIELAKVSAIQKPRAVEVVLKAKEEGKLEGIYGTVSQLCSVDEKYALALEIAGGNALNFIVVEDEDKAIRAVKYLKDVDGGRASFIPLNRINISLNLDKSVLSVEGVIDYAVNLIECDRKFRKVFELVYKDALVVEDIDTAKKFMNKFRVVTLDGDLIEKSGVITGGSIKKKATLGLFDRERRLREDIENLKRSRSELESKLSEVELERKDLEKRIEKLNEDITSLKSKISTSGAKVDEFSKLLKDIEEKLKEKRREAEILNSKALEVEEEINKIEENIRCIEREVKELESKLKDDRIVKLNTKIEEIRGEIERLKDLKSVLSSKQSSLVAKREQLIKAIEEYKSSLNDLEKKITERLNGIEDAKAKILELERRLESLREEERRINKEVGDLREKRDELLKEIDKLEKEKSQKTLAEKLLEERIKDLKEKLADVEKTLESYDIEIPKDLPSLEYVERKLLQVEEELKSFGEINMKAIQEYEDVKKRLDELIEKKKTLERERKEIIEKIKRIEKMKKEAFLSTFNSINEKFKEIVKELADGEGEIYLDKDDPFQSGLHIRFKPFGKPIQRLEAMSGGEKSLLTLAFIFAIQRYKPAPFYAFDEVDMFLDGVNVGRLAKMIKKLSKDAQFIVVSLRKPMLQEADHVIGVTRGGEEESIVTAIQLR
ncbi:chromosome segregation protein SMC [Archaeoglobus profundus]|uniref:Chromosome partition protein Smc n=1 Tax=Archaeoglobus profundus (strain DSM 5631 / JCM 9629 / NBRC 100127 / Av18) TaxID=572546 RepID=D2RFP2_ARCPA|nr:chromosome segregation protein SMC [Archaeoglobus profundus]ADB57117.1 chromosome segregation protein SMC [Archaeoglobus profundus DSM 5631]